MSPTGTHDNRTLKPKKPGSGNPPSIANPGHSGPTTFFLKSEKDIERDMERGRRKSRSNTGGSSEQMTPQASVMDNSSFGVQSLENTISSLSSDRSLSRTDSNLSETSASAGADNVVAGRKRKVNPVHPRIAAAGQRIISSEHLSTQASSAASPASLRSAESPFRTHLRRGSAASSINMSQPLTPLRLSPQPESAMPSTPRSGSLKSFRLSDEESNIADETGSQAIQSSSGEDDDDEGSSRLASNDTDGAEPQLVMPSISMPSRRPFTQQGRHMGRLRVMVVGPKGVGKTSLIKNIFRTCEDIVHVDSALISTPNASTTVHKDAMNEPTKRITEYHASTKPYPVWWSDMESSSVWRRKSFGEGVLERNILFIDTPGIDRQGAAQHILEDLEAIMKQNARMESWSDSHLLTALSGEGGLQVDAVLYVFGAEATSLIEGEKDLLKQLSRMTNLIPLLGRADTCSAEELTFRRRQVLETLDELHCERYAVVEPSLELASVVADSSRLEPFAISSALGDDTETMDASLLMSSEYMQPLVQSDLPYFVDRFMSPGNITRLRHFAAKKFLLWRKEHMGNAVDLHKQRFLHSPQVELPSSFGSPAITANMSLLDEPSKVLVPHSSSSYYRSSSPSAASLELQGKELGTYSQALAKQNQQPSEPYRQFRMAKWAQDLQRSLDSERRRYTRMYTQRPPELPTDENEKHEAALVTSREPRKPAKGRLGGDLSIIDPRDPLGVLALSQSFRRRGWIALQVAGGCGLLGAIVFWTVRNWTEVQEWFGIGQAPYLVNAQAVPAPEKGLADFLQDAADTARALLFGW